MSGPPTPSDFVPYLPPIDPYVLPTAPFDQLITAYGITLLWSKSHTCPCLFGGPVEGSPDPACETCFGRGFYWDLPAAPFIGLITWAHFAPAPDEPGALMDTHRGLIQHATPTLTIPSIAGDVYGEANLYDAFTEVNALERFNAQLEYPYRMSVPYQQSVTIAPSGAVTMYDPVNKIVVPVLGYTVSGVSITVSGGIVSGTSLIVDFTAAPTYVAFRRVGGMTHMRPFGNLDEPRRFMLQTLDLWTRARFPGDPPTGL
jgi:hypothetical protein